MAKVILSIRNLRTYFYTYAGVVKALDGINLDVYEGETLGLVGETGCGKSVTALSILRIVPDPPGKIVEGEILFKGEDLLKKSEEDIQRIRGSRIAMVFQDPMTYINPVFTIGDQISEAILLHQDLSTDVIEMKIDKLQQKLNTASASSSKTDKIKEKIAKLEAMKRGPPKPSRRNAKKAAMRKTMDVLGLVRMPYPEQVIKQYPHELSGGMRQRAVIAMALSCRPDLFIADEATTNLDVTIQAQILALLNALKQEIVGSSVIIITHDLGIVAEMCNRVAVMYAGVIVEETSTEDLFHNPTHPYTKGLLDAIPKLHFKQKRLKVIPGFVPNLIDPPSGCRFHPRCQYAEEICRTEKPEMLEVKPDHFVACHLFSKGKMTKK